MDLLAMHEAALRGTERVVAGVRPEQLDKPTPCTEWDVRALISHMVGINAMFARAGRGEAPAGGPGPSHGTEAPAPDLVGDDPAGAYRQTADDVLAAVDRPGILEETLNLPFGQMPAQFALGLHLIDSLVHRWDLAVATGQDPGLEPEMATVALEMCRTNMAAMKAKDIRGPGKPFAAEVPWPEDASATERLVAFLGRHPHGF